MVTVVHTQRQDAVPCRLLRSHTCLDLDRNTQNSGKCAQNPGLWLFFAVTGSPASTGPGSEARRAPPLGRRVWAPRAAAAPCPRSSPVWRGAPPHPSSCGPGRLRRRQRSRGYTSCGHDRSWPSPASRVLREAASVRPPLRAPAAQSDRSAGRETRSTVPTGSTVPTAPCDPARGPTAGAWDSARLSCLSYEFRL